MRPHNTMMTLTLLEKSTGITYQFIQSHVPGGPVFSIPARKELAKYAHQKFDPNAITILVGDMNRSPDYFIQNFEEEFEVQPFKVLAIPYPTHINTEKEASWIDNIFISNPYEEIKAEVSADFPEMQSTIDLLDSYRPY